MLQVVRADWPRWLNWTGIPRRPGIRVGVVAVAVAFAVVLLLSQVALAVPPANTAPPAITGSAVVGQTLTASTGSWSDSSASLAYQWQQCDSAVANCSDISGEVSSSYVVAAADDGHTLAVVVTATNADGSTPASSAPTAVVVGVSPANTALPSISGTLLVGQTLSAAVGTWSGTTPLTFSYEWQRCLSGTCAAITGAGAQSYTTVNDDAGATLQVVVTASNSGGSASATSNQTGVIGSVTAPVSSVAPAVSGAAVEGGTLTATTGSWTGADTLSFAYQWQRCTDASTCSDITGAIDSSYTAAAADVGDLLQALVTATDSVGPTTQASNQVGPVAASTLPVNVTRPSFSGDPVVGAMLSGSVGDWTGTAPISYALQWQRCTGPAPANCTDIAGADGLTYTVTGADLGLAVQFHVVASNPATGSGPGVDAYSLQATVTNATPTNVNLPAINGTAQEGQPLSADPGSWTGATPLSYSYQWQRCSSAYVAAVASDAPLAYWRFDEPSGTTFGDSSGKGQVATFTAGDVSLNQPGALTSDSDAGAFFNGAKGAEATVSGMSGSYVTVEFWMKWDGVHVGWPASFNAYGVGFTNGGFGFDTAQGQLSGSWTTPTSNLPVNQWVLVDAEFYNGDITNDRLYLDGVQQSMSEGGWPSPSSVGSTMGVGSLYEAPNSYQQGFTGGLDEFAVYNGALAQTRIQAHYNAATASSLCADISGASGSGATTYTSTSADVGQRLRLVVTATNSVGQASSTSETTVPVLPAGAPTNTSPPVITGSGLVGDTLTATPGAWSDSPTGYAYQWQRCSSPTSCSDIAGATQSTYTASTSDAGDTVQVAVTASNVLGSSSPVASTGIPVSNSAPANVTPPTISGDPVEGSTLTTSTGSWSGSQSNLTFSYQWQRCSSAYAAAVTADSPRGYWRLDDGGGTTLADASGNGASASFAFGDVSLNQPGALVSEGDAAAFFDGARGAHVSVSGLSASYTTVEFWIKWDGVDAGFPMGFDAYGLYLRSGMFGFDTAQGQLSGAYTTTNTSPLVNRWALIDAEFYNGDISYGRLFINGVQQSMSVGGSPSPSSVSGTFNIGSLWESPSSSIEGFTGSLDEFAIYNGALSQTRIQAHYDAASATPVCSDIGGATAASYQVQAADAGSQLRVNVTAQNSYGSASAASPTTAAVVVTAPTPAAPLDGGGVKTATPVLSVQPLTGQGSVQYVFEVGADEQFSRQLATSGPLTDTTTWTVPTSAGLKDGQAFWWRAQAITAQGQTSWSAPQKVTVRMVTIGSRPYWPMWSNGPFAVNEATGNLVLSLDGPSFSTPTGAMALSFTYNSQDTRDQGLGQGWTLSGGDPSATPPTTLIDHSRFPSGDAEYYPAAEVDWPDGSSSFYTQVGSSDVYLSPPGDTSQLKRNADGSWTLLDSDGSIYTFAAIASGATSTPLATAQQAAADPNTDVLSYSYGVTSGGQTLLTAIDDKADPGRSITLTWNALNSSGCASAIVCVKGPDGNTWQLAGASGSPTQAPFATLNDGTRVVAGLGYDAAGQLTGYRNADDEAPTDPNVSPGYNGQHSVQIGYDGTSATARVVSFAEGPVTGLASVSACPSQDPICWTFAYHSGGQTDPSQSHGGARDAAGWTEITPPNQQSASSPAKQIVYFDGLDHPIETEDALGRISEAAYNGNDELVWQEDALGNPTDYSWDTLTDTLQSVLGPPNQNGQRPLTRYGYDEAAIGQAGSGSASWTPGPALQGLQAAYYPNLFLAGRPALENDPSVNFNWGDNPPAALPNSVGFSVRWSGFFVAPSAGPYTFTLAAQQGQASALEIDGIQAINNTVSPTASASAVAFLAAGRHQIVIEYIASSRPAQIQFSYSCASCNPVENQQTVPAADLLPAWNNQTSTVSPSGRILFSHFADPTTGQPDYTLQKLADGTPLITSYRYDSYGRLTDQVDPLGNANRTIDSQGNLSGQIDTAHRTTYAYYAVGSTPTIPLACTGGSTTQNAPDQAQGLELVASPGLAATRYVYDAAGRTLAKTDGAGTTCSGYDAEGRVTSRTDGDGNVTRFGYDPAGNKRTVSRADGSTLSSAYDEAGNLVASTDTAGKTTTYSYDAEGNLLATTDPLGIVTRSSYDAVGNKLSDTDGAGNVTGYGYDSLNRLVSTTSPLGEVSRSGYDAAGDVISRTDGNGDTTSYGFDLDGERVSVTDPLGHTSSSVYDNAGRLASTTDANNHTTSFVYDLNGDKVEIDAADGGHTYLSYDAVGDLVSKVDPRGSGPGDAAHMTSYRYDAAGRLVGTTLPTGETTGTVWDAAGNKLASTDAAGHTTSFGYDVLNRLISTTTPLGETTKLGYDAAGNLATRTDALGHRWSYSYDADGRQVAIHDPLGNTTTTAYDQNGNPILATDALGHKTEYRYDADGREIEVIAPDGGINSLTYDAAGNIVQRKDSLDQVTQYAYDADGRLTSVTDPLGGKTSYGYDAAGNRTTVVDANGNATPTAGDGTTSYGYDAANRLTSISYSDSTPAVSYGYDLAGNRTSMTDGAGSQTYGYDNSNRLTAVTRGSSSFGYTYNSAGRLASRTYPDGANTSYAYNADGQIASATTANGTTNYSYDANGQLTATAYPNGWTENRSYDNAGRLADISSSKGAQTIASADYTRDGNGNPTQILRDGNPENYGYDSSGRVTAVCYGAAVVGCPAADLITYTYDSEGNRLTQTNAGSTTDYSYDAADELTQAAIEGGATTSYSYDADGNELSAGSKSFTYDLAGKVTQITDSGTTLASFNYDGLGNRLTKTTASGTTNYLWDENASLPSLAEELNGSTLLRGYQPGQDNGAGLDPIAMTSGTGTYYYSSDGLGSTAAITDQTGTVEWQYTYDPYGNPRTTNKTDPSAPDNVVGFAGQLLDPETGLYDMRARVYDPSTGRFLSTDPMPLPPTEAAVSLYLWGSDDPTLYVDPSGEVQIALMPDGGGCGLQGCAAEYEAQAKGIVKNLCSSGDDSDACHAAMQASRRLSNQAGDAIRQVAPPPSIASVFKAVATGTATTVKKAVTTAVAGAASATQCAWNHGSFYCLGRAITKAAGTAKRAIGSCIRHKSDCVANVGASAMFVVPWTDGEAFLGEEAGAVSAEAAVGSGNGYSVAFETRLAKTSYPGASRAAHFQEANAKLLAAMGSDPEFAAAMENLIPGIRDQLIGRRSVSRAPPSNWTWHHAPEPGVMQLVPRAQHTASGALQRFLHPGGLGGYSSWGR